MRKLAIVTAALALVAVMIAFPAPTAWADPENEVVILKCSESITTTPRGVLVSAAPPEVVVFQSSFSFSTLTPTACGAVSNGAVSNDNGNLVEPNSCAACLKQLVNNGCEDEAAFLVNSRVTELGDNLNSFSIEKYVFACPRARAE